MKNGNKRFEYFLSQLETLLLKSEKQKNPALWLYQNNARTPLFMLEGLAKLYAGIHNKKKFTKLKSHFKLLEDGIGAIDYYDCFAKEFITNSKIPKEITNYIQAQSREKIQSLNEILQEKKWIGNKNSRINKIRKKILTADWQNEEKEVESIRKFYINSIHNILDFVQHKNFCFENVESDVHEFRRKLRWLSIYPQALQGAMQLNEVEKTTAKYLKKYLTQEITKSPYNVMPDAASLKHFLLLSKKRFYALSWMIAELGKLKDSGLKVEIIKESIMQTTKENEASALNKAYKLSGQSQKNIPQILDAAQSITLTYCNEKNLEKLVGFVAAVKK